MNEKPHAHAVRTDNYTHSWYVTYGDQGEFCDRPTRWPWDSEEAYTKRARRSLLGHIARIVRNHDRASQVAPLELMTLPEFRPDAWGSEQLT